MHTIAITTECVADLPNSVVKKENISIIYFDVKTDTGIFRDTDEVNAQNITEYMLNSNKTVFSVIPSPNDYKNFFRRVLEEYDEIIHICISSGISDALENAKRGRAKMGIDGRKIHLMDSRHLSSGTGLLTLEAAGLRDKGMNSREILERLEQMIPRISTTFLCNNADYLYINGKVPKLVRDICKYFRLHPVLQIRDGELKLKKVHIGSYDRAASAYINGILKKPEAVDAETGFVTYVGCGHMRLQNAKEQIERRVSFKKLWMQQASAAISANCGPLTFGVLFINKGEEV